MDFCWIKSFTCYTCCKNALYRVASFLCGFPLATIYGCSFACAAFPHVWILTPFSKAFQICCLSFSRISKQCVLCFVGAPCETFGQIFAAFNTNGRIKKEVSRKRAGVTFSDNVRTKRIPARNAPSVKDQQIARLQAVRNHRR